MSREFSNGSRFEVVRASDPALGRHADSEGLELDWAELQDNTPCKEEPDFSVFQVMAKLFQRVGKNWPAFGCIGINLYE